MKTALTSTGFIARVAFQLAQALHSDLHELHIGIFILILLQIKYSVGLCSLNKQLQLNSEWAI